MKKIVGLAILLFTFYSCEKDTINDPELILSEESIVFNGSEMKSLFITTKPASDCDYQVTSIPSWVTVDNVNGEINQQKSIAEIKISSNFKNLKPGKYEGKLELTTTLGKKSVILSGFVGEISLYSIPKSVDFSVFDNTLKFVIKNEGNVALNYKIENLNNAITLSQNTGDIAVGSQGEITVNIDRANLANGKTSFNLNLNINNKPETIVVNIDTFKQQKITLNSDVIDAEYSKTKDQLVFVTVNPSKVNILKSGTESIETIALSFTPTCISVSQDGETAVVGHDGHITYVNLRTKAIIDSYNVSCYALDIVLAKNKWAYVFPKDDQWEYIRCVNMNLAADNEVHGPENQIYAGTKGRMHPSGKFMYGADNGLSPSDIQKFDIQNGAVNVSYDSPYHGDYPMNGNLWFSEDGNRIFTRGKTVLKTSETKSLDMVYNGKINTDSYSNIEWLDHSATKNNLYIILTDGDNWSLKKSPFIYVYDAMNLSFKSKLELEKYIVPDNIGGGVFYNAEPYFVFSNAAGNSLFVITKASGSGLANEWAIQKIAIL
jgi:hypothetical protein